MNVNIENRNKTRFRSTIVRRFCFHNTISNEMKYKRKINRNNLIFSTTSYVHNDNEDHEDPIIAYQEDIVEVVLKHSFRALQYTDKMNIIKSGRPKPIFEADIKYERSYEACIVSEEIYKKIPWLCGCAKTKRLYCWPCLLFSQGTTDWSTHGYHDLNYVLKNWKSHNCHYQHILSLKEFKLFGKSKYIDIVLRNEYPQFLKRHNSVVEQNRNVLSQLIMIISVLGSLGLDCTGYDYCTNRLQDSVPANMGTYNYSKFINILQNYSDGLHVVAKRYRCAPNIFSSTLYVDLISCISELIIEEIKREISRSIFVTLMMFEVAHANIKRHVTSILRYINDEGNVVERFVDFSVFDSDQNSPALFQYTMNIVDRFNINDKLVAFSYDGALLRIEEHNRFQGLIREKCKHAIFMNAYSNNKKTVGDKSLNFNAILIQSLCSRQRIRVFFSMLKMVNDFFVRSGKCLETIEPYLYITITSGREILESESAFIEILYENKLKIEVMLNSILEKPNLWDMETISSTYAVLIFILKFEFIFFLEIFYIVLPATNKLFDLIQSNILHDSNLIQNKITDLRDLLQKLRADFRSIWSTVCEKSDRINNGICGSPETSFQQNEFYNKKNFQKSSSRDYRTYKVMFFEIIDLIKLNITVRFNEVSKLGFLNLLRPVQTTPGDEFPEMACLRLKANSNLHFDYNSLKSELFVVYKDKGMMKNLHPMKIFNYIRKLDLSTVLPETCKLCDLIVTMPLIRTCYDSDTEKTLPALDRISEYLASKNIAYCNLLVTSNAILYIESNFLDRLRWKMKERFYDQVINKFSDKYDNTSLKYKT